jgi:hypothetical protein
MTAEEDNSNPDASVTFIEHDIDCSFCLENVIEALRALPDVRDVETSSGCLVVTHHETDVASLLQTVADRGHRIARTASGEIVMGSIDAAEVDSCRHSRSGPAVTTGVG